MMVIHFYHGVRDILKIYFLSRKQLNYLKASMSNQFKMAKRLLELGLDKASVANDGKTALMHGTLIQELFL